MEELKERKRKFIPLKIRLEVFNRDNYTCKICQRSGLKIEVDHVQPFSKGGDDDLSNYQTLCFDCNRGKGNDENLNRTAKNELDSILNSINPKILEELKLKSNISVIANQEDYVKVYKINNYWNFYRIISSTNTVSGFGACKNLGIYTIDDNSGSKVHFFISKITPQHIKKL